MKNPFILNRKKHLAEAREVIFGNTVDAFIRRLLTKNFFEKRFKGGNYTFPPCSKIGESEYNRAIRLLGYSDNEPDIFTLLLIASHPDTQRFSKLMLLELLFTCKKQKRIEVLKKVLAIESPVINMETGKVVFDPCEFQWKIIIKTDNDRFLDLYKINSQADLDEIARALSKIPPVLGKYSPDLIRKSKVFRNRTQNETERYILIIKELGNYNGLLIIAILTEILKHEIWEVRETVARTLIKMAKMTFL